MFDGGSLARRFLQDNLEMFTRSSVALVAAVALAAAAGCNTGPAMADKVEGTVMLDGKPLEKVRVEFTPLKEGPQSTAITDDQGKFSLHSLDGERSGAVIGKHKVTLVDQSINVFPYMGKKSETVDLTGGQKPRISNKYSNVVTTPLEVEVTGDTSDIALAPAPYTAGAQPGRER